MPNIKSAEKRLRQSIVRRTKNRAVKHDLKTRMRKVVTALSAGSQDVAKDLFRVTAKKLDQAAAKGVIHRNAAARHKSRLAAKLKTAAAKG